MVLDLVKKGGREWSITPISFEQFALLDENMTERDELEDGGCILRGDCGFAYRSPDGHCIAGSLI